MMAKNTERKQAQREWGSFKTGRIEGARSGAAGRMRIERESGETTRHDAARAA